MKTISFTRVNEKNEPMELAVGALPDVISNDLGMQLGERRRLFDSRQANSAKLSESEPRIYGLDKHLPVSIPSRNVELRENTWPPIHHGDIFYCGAIRFRFESTAVEIVKFRRFLPGKNANLRK